MISAIKKPGLFQIHINVSRVNRFKSNLTNLILEYIILSNGFLCLIVINYFIQYIYNFPAYLKFAIIQTSCICIINHYKHFIIFYEQIWQGFSQNLKFYQHLHSHLAHLCMAVTIKYSLRKKYTDQLSKIFLPVIY